MLSEKRTFSRLIPRRDVFAALGRGITKIGKIKDISRGGSAFEYIIHADIKQKSARDLDIFIPGDEFYLADIPCSVVYDLPINSDNTFTAPFITKRCGIKFCDLSEEQICMLDTLLASYFHITLTRKSQYSVTSAIVTPFP